MPVLNSTDACTFRFAWRIPAPKEAPPRALSVLSVPSVASLLLPLSRSTGLSDEFSGEIAKADVLRRPIGLKLPHLRPSAVSTVFRAPKNSAAEIAEIAVIHEVQFTEPLTTHQFLAQIPVKSPPLAVTRPLGKTTICAHLRPLRFSSVSPSPKKFRRRICRNCRNSESHSLPSTYNPSIFRINCPFLYPTAKLEPAPETPVCPVG
jgi:hypothetical protein